MKSVKGGAFDSFDPRSEDSQLEAEAVIVLGSILGMVLSGWLIAVLTLMVRP